MNYGLLARQKCSVITVKQKKGSGNPDSFSD